MSPRWNNCINPYRARRLYAKFKSWRKVGILLAFEDKRRVPFQAECVRAAVTRYEKQLGVRT